MTTHSLSFHVCPCYTENELSCCNLFWDELHNWLKPYVLAWIHHYNLPLWLGQEQDIAEDVLQETAIRIFKYTRLNQSIRSLENFCITIAHNYVRDLRRRQHKLTHFTFFSETAEGHQQDLPDPDDLLERVLDHLVSNDILVILARIIVEFPSKQQRAILIDLARYSDFDEESGPLHVIFFDLGIDLYEYKLPLPLDPIERSRHASSLSIAYKRLRLAFYEKTGQNVA